MKEGIIFAIERLMELPSRELHNFTPVIKVVSYEDVQELIEQLREEINH